MTTDHTVATPADADDAAGSPTVIETSAQQRRDILRTARTVAVVGASPNPLRPSNSVAAYAINAGYTVYPVNPAVGEVLGLRSYPTLADLPESPDIVDVFRAPDAIAEVVDEAIAAGAKVVWLQLGLRDDAAARKAIDAGLAVVQDRCLKVEHAALVGTAC